MSSSFFWTTVFATLLPVTAFAQVLIKRPQQSAPQDSTRVVVQQRPFPVFGEELICKAKHVQTGVQGSQEVHAYRTGSTGTTIHWTGSPIELVTKIEDSSAQLEVDVRGSKSEGGVPEFQASVFRWSSARHTGLAKAVLDADKATAKSSLDWKALSLNAPLVLTVQKAVVHGQKTIGQVEVVCAKKTPK